MDASIPFTEGTDLIVDIPVDPRGIVVVYIDDLIQATVVIEGTDNAIWCKHAILLAIDTCAHPKLPDDPIPHEDMEARNKLRVEAGLEEQKNVLGWFLDTDNSSCNYQRISLLHGQTSSTWSSSV
jgi:hypothetical protein